MVILLSIYLVVFVLQINYSSFGRFLNDHCITQLLEDKFDRSDPKSVPYIALLACEDKEINDLEEVEELTCFDTDELETAINADQFKQRIKTRNNTDSIFIVVKTDLSGPETSFLHSKTTSNFVTHLPGFMKEAREKVNAFDM